MKIWFDTEFISQSLTMLSIGAVREDGTAFYAVVEGADTSQADDFVKEHVIPKLGTTTTPLSVIAREFKIFCGDKPEFWGYFADYDWFYLCQMYGGMLCLPKDWPQFCFDIIQEMAMRGVSHRVPIDKDREHNALYDALWTKQQYHVTMMSPR